MKGSFNSDDYPGRPKILFVGLAQSSHTHSWIDLLDRAELNVRLFAMPSAAPPEMWGVRTYVTAEIYPPPSESPLRAYLHPPPPPPESRWVHFAKRKWERVTGRSEARRRDARNTTRLPSEWLAEVIREWRPDIIHTLGLESGGEFYFGVRREFQLEGLGKWVLQTRGGSDLALSHLNPERRGKIAEILRACDQLLSDNEQNYHIAHEMGVREDQLSAIGTVPGTGGIDVESMSHNWRGATSSRRLILWPKAYDCCWSVALPVFEALKMCWEKIQPCEIRMLAMTDETRDWFWTLPEEMRASCRADERIPRAQVLELMPQARVMLAPSLVDGMPNSLYEAMAAGAFPIVSPLETIRPVVEHERNVLFARNLYAHEIAEALTRAMNDDALVDAAAARNLELVRRVAERSEVRARVRRFYERLAGESRGGS